MKHSTRWLVLILFPVIACAVDFNDPKSVTDQDFFLSFWRSGTNWLFTCIQAISRKPIRFIVKDDFGGFGSSPCVNHLRIPINIAKNPLFHTHSCDFVSPFSKDNRLLLIVRNYKETIMRHCLDDPLAFSEAIDDDELFDYYSEYLATYDSWNPDKRLLVYYEDLLNNPRETLSDVLAFLDEPDDGLEAFMSNYEQYRLKTMASYHKQYADAGGSMSKGQDMHFHSKHLSEDLQIRADKLMESKYPFLCDRYLKRYLYIPSTSSKITNP